MKKMTRRDWLKSGYAAAAVASGSFAYGGLIERGVPKLERVTCSIPERYHHLAGIRIGLISDFHFDEFGDPELVYRAVKMINQEKVDFVMLAGDFVSNQASALEPLGEILKGLRARIGIFAVLGNHDQWMGSDHAANFLKKIGARLLRNDVEDLGDFIIAGLESAWGGKPDYRKIPNKSTTDKPIILGWHEPDTFDWFDDDRVVLQMSGHTHGGQICAPVIGSVLLPHLGKNYASGLFQRGDSSLYVTRGLGVISIPARFLCPPEVTILSLGAVGDKG